MSVDSEVNTIGSLNKVVEDDILVSILSLEFDSPTAEASYRISGSALWADRRDAGDQFGVFPNASQEVCVRNVGELMSDFEQPNTLAAFAWTTRFGILFLEKWARVSIN